MVRFAILVTIVEVDAAVSKAQAFVHPFVDGKMNMLLGCELTDKR